MNKFAAKLTPEQRQLIVDRFDAGEEREALAKEYGVHPRTVDKIIFGGQRRYPRLQRTGLRPRPAPRGYIVPTPGVQAQPPAGAAIAPSTSPVPSAVPTVNRD